MQVRPFSRLFWQGELICFCLALIFVSNSIYARPSAKKPTPSPTPTPTAAMDDSLVRQPARDLGLQPQGLRKADALAQFTEGERWEDLGEIEKALGAYEKVLTVDPGEVELALHVADLLSRQDDYPLAVDVLKDAIKSKPKEPAPYLQLALIYSKDLHKMDQGLKYANEALALDPKNIDVYQRLFEIAQAAGQPKKATEALDLAAKVQSKDAAFWLQLGKLYASIVFKTGGAAPKPDEVRRVNTIFKKAADLANDDADMLKDVADYFAASDQIADALPYYLKVLELEPDDVNAREKLANGFVLTNQWPQAIAVLQEIIKTHPEKSQAYELLAGVFEDEARSFVRLKQSDKAKEDFAKAAQNYDQSILINPTRLTNYMRLAELLLGRLQDNKRAVQVLQDARRRFPGEPEIAYYLALALREAKQPEAAVTTFEEALREAELSSNDIVNARFYFDYGATAEQAGLYDKAADLFKKSIAIDPANAAEAYNYLGYMWAERGTHLDEADEMIHRALQLDPNNGAYLDSLGWLDFRRGKFEQALEELQHALQALPKPDATVLEHVGDVSAKLNQIPQALDYWQRASLLDPTNKKLAEKIENTKTKLSKGLKPKGDPVR